jgi:hypothetical protein
MLNPRFLLPLLALLGFGGFSTWVVVTHGYLGFLELAGREPWGLQVLLDVGLACIIASIGLVRDARERRLPIAPYLVATFFLGSLGLLGYLVHRAVAGQLAGARSPAPQASRSAAA